MGEDKRLIKDGLLAERARLLSKGWRMTEYHWLRIEQIDALLEKLGD
jgi:hypothetical protein